MSDIRHFKNKESPLHKLIITAHFIKTKHSAPKAVSWINRNVPEQLRYAVRRQVL